MSDLTISNLIEITQANLAFLARCFKLENYLEENKLWNKISEALEGVDSDNEDGDFNSQESFPALAKLNIEGLVEIMKYFNENTSMDFSLESLIENSKILFPEFNDVYNESDIDLYADGSMSFIQNVANVLKYPLEVRNLLITMQLYYYYAGKFLGRGGIDEDQTYDDQINQLKQECLKLID